MSPNVNADNTEPNPSTESGLPAEDSLESQAPTALQAKDDPFLSLLKDIQDQKSNDQLAINDSVITELVKADADDKKNMILAGIKKFHEAQAELNKIRPDNQVFDEFGKAIAALSGYSKAKAEERKKAAEKLEKIRKAMSLACKENNPDYSKLKELSNQKN